jgi:hypothetical protein
MLVGILMAVDDEIPDGSMIRVFHTVSNYLVFRYN